MRPARSIVAAALLAITVSCRGGTGDDAGEVTNTSTTPATQTPEGTTPEGTTPEGTTVEAAIIGFDDGPSTLSRSISAVNRAAAQDPDALRAVALSNLGSADRSRRFAAVLALTMTASTLDEASMGALRTLSGASDTTERLLAAGSLAALGDRGGVDILIEALDSQEILRNLDPPFAAWRYARANLLLFVDQDLGLVDAVDAPAAAAAQTDWRTWWAAHGADATWNAELGRYEVAS